MELSMADRHEIARALREVSTLLQAKGENQFKVRAYETGARALTELTSDLGTLVKEKRLTELSGIGDALAEKITSMYETGSFPLLDRLRLEFPAGVRALLQVPDLGPKRVAVLREKLAIDSPEALLEACRAGSVRQIAGFSEKLEAKLITHLSKPARPSRILLKDALAVGESLLASLRRHPSVLQAELAGSLRRSRETVGDLDMVVSTHHPESVADAFVTLGDVASVESRGPTKVTVILHTGVQVDLRMVLPESWATALHHFTGSKAAHVRLRGRARDRGLSISEYALTPLDGGTPLHPANEADLYAILGLPYIPPEMREDEGEFEAAEAGDRFGDLLTFADLRGMTHCHTTFSDGRNSVEEMARAAQQMGLEYMTITDHSPTAGYAGGLDAERLQRQWDEIDAVQQKVKIRLLKGCESDILSDGALDYPDAILDRLDVVIASVHQRYRLDPEKMTERLVRCMALPVFKIWGHPLGRLLEERDPIACDVEAVLDTIARSRAAVEINGDPHRLDLEPKWAREAKKRGIKFVVSSDAHSVGGLEAIRFGVMMARKAGIRRSDVLNALPVDAFAAAVRPGSSVPR
jgi:DNA polymerase (family 10)